MNNIDYDFVRRCVGPSCLPISGPSNTSGVRIGKKTDLGKLSPAGLKSMGVSPALRKKLEPFVGKTGAEAVANWKWRPLRLSASEQAALLKLETRQLADHLDAKYLASPANKKRRSVGSLPRGAQTVLMALTLQHGLDLDRRLPEVWPAMCAQQWKAALDAIRNMRGSRPGRDGQIRLLKAIA